MSKEITIKLSENEYANLLFYYNLGYLVADHILEKDKAALVEEAEFNIKLCKQGYEQGSTVVFGAVKEGIYTINGQMEERMLEMLEEFKEYIQSGVDDMFDDEMQKLLDDMDKQEKKNRRKNK